MVHVNDDMSPVVFPRQLYVFLKHVWPKVGIHLILLHCYIHYQPHIYNKKGIIFSSKLVSCLKEHHYKYNWEMMFSMVKLMYYN